VGQCQKHGGPLHRLGGGDDGGVARHVERSERRRGGPHGAAHVECAPRGNPDAVPDDDEPLDVEPARWRRS
jgi:hypothetical protein